MEVKKCFEPGCAIEAKIACSCCSPETYYCEPHARKHIEMPNKAHILEPIIAEPRKERKEAILLCLEKKESKKVNLKSEWLEYPGENLFALTNYLIKRRSEIENLPKDQNLEQEFRSFSSSYEKNQDDYQSSGSLIKAYEDYANIYCQKTALYNIKYEYDNIVLHIYETELERKDSKLLFPPNQLDFSTCITQLPNRKLFCYGNKNNSGVTLLIGLDCEFEILPSGKPCCISSAIYFDNNVYCFGGWNDKLLSLSSRFDLRTKRWVKLTPLPETDSGCCSIIYNRNILISGYKRKNLWLYSIDIEAFSTIPYEFSKLKKKILLNTEERLYLIECTEVLYECEIGSYTNWSRIRGLTINHNPSQVYLSFNKGAIYIGCNYGWNQLRYYKFNLEKKSVEYADSTAYF